MSENQNNACTLIFNPLYGFLLKQECSKLSDIIIIDSDTPDDEIIKKIKTYKKINIMKNRVENIPDFLIELCENDNVLIEEYIDSEFKDFLLKLS